MNYFKNEFNEVFVYDDIQVELGVAVDLISITKDEMLELTKDTTPYIEVDIDYMKYFKDDNNKIYGFTDEDVKKGYGSKLISITKDEMLELTKVTVTTEQNAVMINAKANQLIEEKYPIYKQLNITNLLTPYTEVDRDNMKIFIENIREISNTAIANGTLLKDINWL